MVEQAEPKSHRTLWIGAGVVIAAGAITAAFVLSSASEPQPFTLTGEIVLDADGAFSMNPRCGGKDGYDDINRGASVTVYDAAGKVVAKGELGEGKFVGQKANDPCAFPFSVANVPAGESFYQVEVSHRGKVTVEQKEAQAGGVSLTLG